MELQSEAERFKRSDILASEGRRQSTINVSEGEKNSIILKAEGEARAISMKAQATAQALQMLSQAFQSKKSIKAAQLQLAEKYVHAFRQLAQPKNTLIIQANASNAQKMTSQALSIFSDAQNEQIDTEKIQKELEDQTSRNQEQQTFQQSSYQPIEQNLPFENKSQSVLDNLQMLENLAQASKKQPETEKSGQKEDHDISEVEEMLKGKL